ncbi:ubiquitin-conjugating enzyme 25 [Actinidia rufa]|uniref:Ubiquitin-conjugating enzyme 25 n=1 Tax=Actinidia rufa TaxID=165716 RepID=A0A7J0GSU9_9ERIC|nr:ubiquitin-conjugating enzyme 25 [Actinidia rufa]
MSTSFEFKQFDVVLDPSDHHYVNSKVNIDCFTNENSGVHRKIMREWKILQEGLPESIYVRVYEDRIDLIRAVIVGAPGTPYHDGLFFFDIQLPSNYPYQPPKVYYHSHGIRLNPNLYTRGFVCLSLINTWDGNKKERWDTSSSTILQVLVSIQGLVLNERPYFNEPGMAYAKTKQNKKWIDRSLAYNEDAFALSCKTMLYVFRNPPKNFKGFVSQHFHQRKDAILGAIKAYLEGSATVGYYQHNGSSSSSKASVPANFRVTMTKLYWELKEAFMPGATQARPVMIKIEKVSTDTIEKKQPKQGMRQKLSGFFKWFME